MESTYNENSIHHVFCPDAIQISNSGTSSALTDMVQSSSTIILENRFFEEFPVLDVTGECTDQIYPQFAREYQNGMCVNAKTRTLLNASNSHIKTDNGVDWSVHYSIVNFNLSVKNFFNSSVLQYILKHYPNNKLIRSELGQAIIVDRIVVPLRLLLKQTIEKYGNYMTKQYNNRSNKDKLHRNHQLIIQIHLPDLLSGRITEKYSDKMDVPKQPIFHKNQKSSDSDGVFPETINDWTTNIYPTSDPTLQNEIRRVFDCALATKLIYSDRINNRGLPMFLNLKSLQFDDTGVEEYIDELKNNKKYIINDVHFTLNLSNNTFNGSTYIMMSQMFKAQSDLLFVGIGCGDDVEDSKKTLVNVIKSDEVGDLIHPIFRDFLRRLLSNTDHGSCAQIPHPFNHFDINKFCGSVCIDSDAEKYGLFNAVSIDKIHLDAETGHRRYKLSYFDNRKYGSNISYDTYGKSSYENHTISSVVIEYLHREITKIICIDTPYLEDIRTDVWDKFSNGVSNNLKKKTTGRRKYSPDVMIYDSAQIAFDTSRSSIKRVSAFDQLVNDKEENIKNNLVGVDYMSSYQQSVDLNKSCSLTMPLRFNMSARTIGGTYTFSGSRFLMKKMERFMSNLEIDDDTNKRPISDHPLSHVYGIVFDNMMSGAEMNNTDLVKLSPHEHIYETESSTDNIKNSNPHNNYSLKTPKLQKNYVGVRCRYSNRLKTYRIQAMAIGLDDISLSSDVCVYNSMFGHIYQYTTPTFDYDTNTDTQIVENVNEDINSFHRQGESANRHEVIDKGEYVVYPENDMTRISSFLSSDKKKDMTANTVLLNLLIPSKTDLRSSKKLNIKSSVYDKSIVFPLSSFGMLETLDMDIYAMNDAVERSMKLYKSNDYSMFLNFAGDHRSDAYSIYQYSGYTQQPLFVSTDSEIGLCNYETKFKNYTPSNDNNVNSSNNRFFYRFIPVNDNIEPYDFFLPNIGRINVNNPNISTDANTIYMLLKLIGFNITRINSFMYYNDPIEYGIWKKETKEIGEQPTDIYIGGELIASFSRKTKRMV